MQNSRSEIVLFVTDTEADALVFQVLKQHFAQVTVVKTLKPLCKLLVEPHSKIILLTGDSLENSIYSYYRALDAVADYPICEHRIVSLVPRQCEQLAYDAFRAKIVDDYMVSRPVYELHRIILICEHLMIELGIIPSAQASKPVDAKQQIGNFQHGLQSSIEKGLMRKTHLKNEFEHSVAEIESALECAAHKIQQNQPTELDIKKLKETLAAIRSDQIRPELLRLQGKALDLLEKSLINEQELDNPPASQPSANESTIQSNNKATVNKDAQQNKVSYEFNRLYKQDVDPEELLKQNAQKPTILLVEDDIISMQLTKRLLGHYKVILEVANNGRQAFACLTSKKYDLVLMDVNLPDTNGIYIVNQSRAENSKNSDTPIIMLSGNKEKATVNSAIERGAKGYLVKPLSKKAVDTLFEKYLAHHINQHSS